MIFIWCADLHPLVHTPCTHPMTLPDFLLVRTTIERTSPRDRN